MKHYAENLGSNVGAMIKVRQVVNFFLFFNNNNFFRTFEAWCCLRHLSYTISYVNTVVQ